MRDKFAPPEAELARIAARQHGVVTTAQLAAAGIDKDAVGRRVDAGRLHRLHRGVYAVGHRGVSREGRWLAAILACGDRAVLSHRDAATHWELLPLARRPVDISVPGHRGRGRRRGIRIHRPRNLPAGDVTRHRSIPITSPARTIADMRRTVAPRELRRAIRRAEVLGLPLGLEGEVEGTRSELEHRFLHLCRPHRIPEPEVNARRYPPRRLPLA